MPVSTLHCPHCEALVEIHVVAVTRSRACPQCGEVLVLQVEASGSGTKRKALLVAATPPVDVAPAAAAPRNAFLEMPEDPFERMRLDPSLARVRTKFLLGVGAVAAIVAAAIVAHHWQGPQPVAAGMPPKARAAPPAAVEPPIQYLQPVFTAAPLEQRLGQAATGIDGQTATGRKPEQLAAPVFDLAEEITAPSSPAESAPPVFEVSDLSAVAPPRP